MGLALGSELGFDRQLGLSGVGSGARSWKGNPGLVGFVLA